MGYGEPNPVPKHALVPKTVNEEMKKDRYALV